MGHEPLVELVLPGHEDGQRLLPGPAGPARLLPERCDRAGEAVEDAGVERADVDAELERAGGGDGPKATLEQLGLDLAALLCEVAAAIGAHRGGQLVRQAVLGVLGHQLGRLSAAGEGDGAVPVLHQRGQQHRSLAVGRRPGAGRRVEQRRVPEGEEALAARRAVVGHLRDRLAAQGRGQLAGPADGRGAEHEGRVRAVVRAQAPQPAQDVGHVGPEDPPQRVELVDDDEAQAGEELGPAAVGREDPDVEHVGVRQDRGRLPPGPRPSLGRRVAVVRHRDEPRDLEGGEGPQLVLRECLRGVEQQGGAPLGAGRGLRDRQLVAERLARRGAGGNRHRSPGAREIDGRGLVAPEAVGGHEAPQVGRERMGERRDPGAARRKPFDGHELTAVVERPHQRLEVTHGDQTGTTDRRTR